MKSLVMAAFILFSISIFAQMGVSIYPLNNTIGVKTSNQKNLSFELRLGFDASQSTADLLYIIQPEANIIYRIRKEERVNFFTGIGGGYGLNNANGNYTSGGILLGIEFFPVASMRNFIFTAELNPDTKFYVGYQTYKMAGLIGFSYYFLKPAKITKNE